MKIGVGSVDVNQTTSVRTVRCVHQGSTNTPTVSVSTCSAFWVQLFKTLLA